MAKDNPQTKTLGQQKIEEGMAKCLIPGVEWESAPLSVRNRSKERARELLAYLDSQGVKLPDGTRLIRG